ncbi:MAG: hypothetical protein ABSE46_24515, partial [Terracidiphilus sp.]
MAGRKTEGWSKLAEAQAGGDRIGCFMQIQSNKVDTKSLNHASYECQNFIEQAENQIMAKIIGIDLG